MTRRLYDEFDYKVCIDDESYPAIFEYVMEGDECIACKVAEWGIGRQGRAELVCLLGEEEVKRQENRINVWEMIAA